MPKSANIFFSESILWAIFTAAFLVFVLASLVLVYHWKKYGLKDKKIITAQIVYLLGAIFFFSMALFSILLY